MDAWMFTDLGLKIKVLTFWCKYTVYFNVWNFYWLNEIAEVLEYIVNEILVMTFLIKNEILVMTFLIIIMFIKNIYMYPWMSLWFYIMINCLILNPSNADATFV